MPSYDYRCQSCGKFTITQGIREPKLTSCPTCGSPVNRLIGKNVNILFKCSGFYTTDSKAAGNSCSQCDCSDGSSCGNDIVSE